MRSSKKRSRSNQNRPRTLGNIINRVFDSSGPEGKVRGTPQQIIEKYQMLARDAQLSNDRVAAENFLQHAEHYTRLLAEAQREMAAEQEARQQQFQQNGGGNRDFRDRDRDRDRDRSENWRERGEDREPREGGGEGAPGGAEVIDLGSDAGLVDTPEARRPEGRAERGDRPERREDRPREDRARDERPREDRSRDDRPREDRPRDDRPQGERRDRDFRRDRDDRRRDQAEPAPAAAALPDFITGGSTPVVTAPETAPQTAPEPAASKPRRAPRKPKTESAAE